MEGVMADEKFILTKGADRMTVTILEDGSWRVDVEGSVSAVNHGVAEAFLAEVSRALGGDTKVEKQGHAHAHAHAHDGVTHSH